MQAAYLGPAGTFSQQAAELMCPGHPTLPLPSIEDVFEAVANGQCIGVVPFENSTEGPVNATLDAMLFDYDISIQALLPLPICQCLMTKPSSTDKDITKIFSHPQSLAQCKRYLRHHFPQAEIVAAASNGDAARQVLESSEPWAAIGPRIAAELYDLLLQAENIQDHPNNRTSFIQIAPEKQHLPVTGQNASFAFSVRNKPGELHRMLGIFDIHSVNMTKIISRPMKDMPGEYAFFIDIEGYEADDAAQALALIQRRALFYKFLGSYPIL